MKLGFFRGSALLLCLSLSACGVIRFESSLPEAPRPASPPSAVSQAPPPLREAKPPLPQDDPYKTLAAIRREVRAGAQEAGFGDLYPTAANKAIAAADALRRQGELARAGKGYRQVLDAYPRTPALASKVKRSREALAAEMRGCAEGLMEKGLAEYRRGRLERALALWRDILAFDPEHAGARRAVDTATRQIEALRTLD